jgi:hypothetical protein
MVGYVCRFQHVAAAGINNTTGNCLLAKAWTVIGKHSTPDMLLI